MKNRAIGSKRTAFTLVELLVVIGIIVILVGLLVAGVGKARQAANNAASQNWIAQITAAVESYYGDQRAYPGPLSNDQIATAGAIGFTPPNLAGPGLTAVTAGQITMSENLTLGLLGGLIVTTNVATPINYDPNLVGKGPRTLNASNPKVLKAYIEAPDDALSWRIVAGVKTGTFADAAGTAADTVIPELTDRFPDPLPVLYLRARVGATGVITAYPTPANEVAQYDLRQIIGYTNTNIGVGKSTDGSTYNPVVASNKQPLHGLRATNDTATAHPYQTSLYPYDATTVFIDPSVTPTGLTGVVRLNPAAQARRKDSFILIGAGPDRVYGTKDDITNFGSVK